ncbi:MAG: hercynine metabolism protein [Cyanobium sp.]
MAGSGNWLDQLEVRLQETLESFLQANPQQESLLAEQEARERQQQLRRDRLALKAEAELQRQGLLRLAEDIRCWQERVDRAKGAGALELAGRAEAHIATLMDQGRARWQTLDELGERFAAVERELQHLGSNPSGPASEAAAGPEAKPKAQTSGPDLEADWAAFETQQELDALRRKMQG